MRRNRLAVSLLVSVVIAVGISATPTGGKPRVNEAVSCTGKSRWDVKRLADDGAGQIYFSPKRVSVDALIANKTRPAHVGHKSERFLPDVDKTPVETTVYRVSAVLIKAKHIKSEDQDIHLVIAQKRSRNPKTMIVEFPLLACVDRGAKKRAEMLDARTEFENACTPPPSSDFQIYSKGAATITGVGFWDVKHGRPKGASPDYIELHPVLSFRLRRARGA